MAEGALFAAIIATFLLAGTVKGVIGLGLPSVSLGLLTVAADLPTAMALLLVPSFVTNLWQASVGGKAGEIIRRLWPFLLTATFTVWLGAQALTQIDLGHLSALLGVLLVTYAAISLAGIRMTFSPRHEAWAGPLMGSANGILTGMTGSFVVPGVMFLQAIGLPRDMLIQAMGILFTASTVALAAALQSNNMLTAENGWFSLAGLAPALIGMLIGQKIRQSLPEDTFRRVFFCALLILGGYIVSTAVFGG
ncbi:MAG: sulfite exporter TauE/SafE family protein [Alphaproteobacteria bacterium]|nr:sulfite exporter TauE/SafE family protein [Alphaproteobacteria bacterium]